MAEGRRQPWGLHPHFKDLWAGNASWGGGAEGSPRRRRAGGLRLEGGRSPFCALPPWPTLPPGPPPFH